MPNAIHVESVDMLQELDRRFGGFRASLVGVSKGPMAHAERQLGELGERLNSARREAEMYREFASSQDCEDENWVDYGPDIRAAEQAAASLSRSIRKVESALEVFSRASRQFSGFLDSDIPKAQQLLRNFVSDLGAYTALKPRGRDVADSGSGARPSAPSPSVTAYSTTNVASYNLPPGYSWISIADIDPIALNEIGGPEDFKKNVSYNEMVQGFELLRTEVLPVIDDHSSGSLYDRFFDIDRERGVDPAQGLTRIYEAFFGNDPIFLDRGSRQTTFSVTSGRHRIKVAQDSGWKAVPCKSCDLG